ncbi:hypothetical protein HaLaN_15697, partial [Haematococcus lacustris]
MANRLPHGCPELPFSSMPHTWWSLAILEARQIQSHARVWYALCPLYGQQHTARSWRHIHNNVDVCMWSVHEATLG